MKIGFTADIHWDHSDFPESVWGETVQELNDLKLDVLVLGGDIAVEECGFMSALDFFSKVDCEQKMYVLGNHDVWIFQDSLYKSSIEKYNFLKSVAEQHGFHCLDNGPIVLGEIGFVGNIGWYDYSFRDKQIDLLYPNSINSYRKKRFPNNNGKGWADGEYVKWNRTDIEMSIYFSELLKRHICSINHLVHTICYFSHHVPMQLLVPYGNISWNMGHAFQGSSLFEDIIFDNDKIRYVFCGHSHKEIIRQIGDKKCFNVGTGYNQPKYVMVEV